MAAFAGSAFAGSTYDVIHRFQQSGNGGLNPTNLIADGAGNLYGITNSGGKYDFGTVYELTPPGESGGSWKRTTLYSFPDGVGVLESAGAGWLIMDKAGNLYGVTLYGQGCQIGCGTVFKLAPPKKSGGRWTETTLYVFSLWAGWHPGGLALDKEGNIYGTTYFGGRGCQSIGCGTVYKLTPAKHGKRWKRTVIYFFKGVPGGRGTGDGAEPFDVVFDPKGNLYGLTESGGICVAGFCSGTAFKLKPPEKKGSSWTETVLYRFNFESNGDQLYSGVVLDKSGALYGGTQDILYRLALVKGTWTETVLLDQGYIYSGVVLGDDGNLYGTDLWDVNDTNGTVFELSPPGGNGGQWAETVLHDFAAGRDGSAPASNMVFGLNGALYGTTLRGGNNQCEIGGGNVGCGTVFEIAP
jgi:uncharacterized repeat protein (TIGR03803 family)